MKAKDDPQRRPQRGTFFLLGRYTVRDGQLRRDNWQVGETFLDLRGFEYVVAPGGNLVRFTV